MKTLVVYYTRTGNTRIVAEKIAGILKADIEEILEPGREGWNTASKVLFRKGTEIKYKKDPKNYDLVVVGTPVLAWAVAPPIRTYLKENKFKNVAFFCTYGSNFSKTFVEMEKLSKRPLAILSLKFKRFKKQEIDSNYMNKIKEFCGKLK